MLLVLLACASPPAGESAPDPTTTEDSGPTGPADADGDGVVDADDCDPHDAAVHPGATEHADGVDEDCDGTVDGTVSTDTAPARVVGVVEGDALGTAALALDGRLWLGVPGAAVTGSGEGRVVGFDRPLAGPTDRDAAVAELHGIAAGGGLGTALAAADVDGDGVDELLAGAPGAARVYAFPTVFEGVASARAARVTVSGGPLRDRFGAALAVGDLDGDGRPDLVAGAPGATGPEGDVSDDAGAVYLLGDLGADPDVDLTPAATGPFRDARAGSAVAAGDLDGDGADEGVVGVPIQDYPGRVYLVDLAPPPSLGDLPIWLEGTAPGDGLGAAVAVADLDGDGYADVLAGAPGLAHLVLVYGSPGARARSGPEVDATILAREMSGLGAATRALDLDGDGAPEVLGAGEGQAGAWAGPFLGTVDHPGLRLQDPGGAAAVLGGGPDLVLADPGGVGTAWVFPTW